MAISLQRGERVSLEQIDVFADGVAIKRAGAVPYPIPCSAWSACIANCIHGMSSLCRV